MKRSIDSSAEAERAILHGNARNTVTEVYARRFVAVGKYRRVQVGMVLASSADVYNRLSGQGVLCYTDGPDGMSVTMAGWLPQYHEVLRSATSDSSAAMIALDDSD